MLAPADFEDIVFSFRFYLNTLLCEIKSIISEKRLPMGVRGRDGDRLVMMKELLRWTLLVRRIFAHIQ